MATQVPSFHLFWKILGVLGGEINPSNASSLQYLSLATINHAITANNFHLFVYFQDHYHHCVLGSVQVLHQLIPPIKTFILFSTILIYFRMLLCDPGNLAPGHFLEIKALNVYLSKFCSCIGKIMFK